LQGARKFHPSGVQCRCTRNMEKPRRRSPTELPMLFEMVPQPLAEELTALEYNAGECGCRKKAAGFAASFISS
jgi:hypothetical protein